ncbi:ribonuclease H-like domain-containing protein [Candidatus Wolfebacteria bacterium]|nr:ribonuclease H-like domain-containing protein [Candidatus Wolfebacteria bacterium]
MHTIVFDIETKNFFEDVGKNDPTLLDIALVAIHDSAADAYTSYLDSELSDLWPLIERVDALVGFNSDHFDIPLLNKYYPGDLTTIKSVDIMKSVKDSLGHRLSLNNLAQATLGRGKIADGLQASRWWKLGEIEKIRQYCIEDVRLTKELYDYALKHGKLIYRDGPDTREVSVDTTAWKDSSGHSMTHTLGF